MSLAILVDMNLSPDWVPLLRQRGWSAVHWSMVGDPAPRIPPSWRGPRAIGMSYSPMTLTSVRHSH